MMGIRSPSKTPEVGEIVVVVASRAAGDHGFTHPHKPMPAIVTSVWNENLISCVAFNDQGGDDTLKCQSIYHRDGAPEGADFYVLRSEMGAE